MLTLIIKIILLTLGLLIVADYTMITQLLISLLVAITFTALNQYKTQKNFTIASTMGYLLLCINLPLGWVFLPIIFFDLGEHFKLVFMASFPLVFVFAIGHIESQGLLLLVLLSCISLILSYMKQHIHLLSTLNRKIRDDNAEQKLELSQKNQELMGRHDNDIHLATLKERNRIARDIHDHVGHSLARAILQVGALTTINQDERMRDMLTDLQGVLTGSMNDIRKSIHDLKDDAIDLHEAIEKLLANAAIETNLNYDIASSVSNPIKYCFLTVVKEALTNTVKHSDATVMSIRIQEHPGLYQLLIFDNGTNEPVDSSKRGIGLRNIEERVLELEGYSRIEYQNGFRIFITIPKKED